MSVQLTLPGAKAASWRCAHCGTTLNTSTAAADPRVHGPGRSFESKRGAPPPLPRIFRSHGSIRESRPHRLNIRSPIESDVSRSLDRQIETGRVLHLPAQSTAFRLKLSSPARPEYDRSAMESLANRYHSTLDDVSRQFESLRNRGTSQIDVWRGLAAEYLARYAADQDLLACMAIRPTHGDYPARHSLHTAIVAMAVASTLGWDEPTLIDVALGCFLHDAGMQQLDAIDVRAPRAFGAAEITAVAAHPVHTLDLLKHQWSDHSDTSRMVAYQMHERCNGTGYPSGRSGGQIHPAAKVAAVADAFVALCSPRPYRPALIPYYAMVALLDGVRVGLFDARAMRALLQTVSLFPVGSNIALAGTTVGRVLRTNRDRYDRPVVEVWDAEDPSSSRTIVDLSREPDRWHPRPMPDVV